MMILCKRWFIILLLTTGTFFLFSDYSLAVPYYSIKLLTSGQTIGPSPGSNIFNDQIGHDPEDGDFIVNGSDNSKTYLYELGVPVGYLMPTASDINDLREIVGNAYFVDEQCFAYYRDENGTVSNLGTINNYRSPNDTQSTALAINNRSEIVGYSVARDESEYYQPYLFSEGEMFLFENILLDNAGWSFLDHYAYDLNINDLGVICGTGYLNGTIESFVMTPVSMPVPEPSGLILLVAGIISLLGFSKKNVKI